MSRIYLYDGDFPKGDKGFDMIRAAAALYAGEAGLDLNIRDSDILRQDMGKPYFADIPIEFSLSHSGRVWMCMFDDMACGLDIQHVKECRFEMIARRNYTAEEQYYVKLWGQRGFFDVWVRKEAFAKCTGRGFFSEMPSMVDQNHDMKTCIEWDGTTYYLYDIEISESIKCAVCSVKQSGSHEMRVLA